MRDQFGAHAGNHATIPTLRQGWQVLRWVNNCDPRQSGLDFGLWTRAVVTELSERKFGQQLGQRQSISAALAVNAKGAFWASAPAWPALRCALASRRTSALSNNRND